MPNACLASYKSRFFERAVERDAFLGQRQCNSDARFSFHITHEQSKIVQQHAQGSAKSSQVKAKYLTRKQQNEKQMGHCTLPLVIESSIERADQATQGMADHSVSSPVKELNHSVGILNEALDGIIFGGAVEDRPCPAKSKATISSDFEDPDRNPRCP